MNRSRTWFIVLTTAFLVLLATHARAQEAAAGNPRPQPFGIQVVDEQTHRGVPLVELKTTSNVSFFTDSGGWAAIDDPAMLGRRVFFLVSSHGYEFSADGFGFRGRALDVKAGETVTLKIKRTNLAERLYRVTGEGIYRDSVLLGKKPPVAEPLLNAEIVGQDSVQRVVLGDKVYWFWGDTSRQRYPLGHFGMSGAASLLPGKGGLSPDVGIDFKYFTGDDGFARPTFEREGALLQWSDGYLVLKDDTGRDRVLAMLSVRKSLTEEHDRRLVEFDPATGMHKSLKKLPMDSSLRPSGPSFIAERDGKKHVYFCRPQPDVRVAADFTAAQDMSQYEAFTCLAAGQKSIGPETQLHRDEAGKLVWAWKRDTEPVGREDVEKLVKLGKMKADEAWLRPTAADTGAPIRLHAGSVAWNGFRNKWVMIANEIGGKSSMLGEVWCLEADAPEGPWDKAVKVVTHDRYSLYNPVHHPFFDQENGRYIYFEGTYSHTFDRKADITPRYDYNNVMYKLDLQRVAEALGK